MKKWMRRMVLSVSLLLMMVGTTAFAAEDRILNGVMIDQVDVSGMTKAEALEALEAYEAEIGAQSLKLAVGEIVLDAKLTDFGVSYDNEAVVDEALSLGREGNIVKRYKDQKELQQNGKVLGLSWNVSEEQVRSYVEENCTKYDQKAQNASLTRENGEFQFVPGKQGLALDVNASVSAIMEMLESGWTSEDRDTVLALMTKITEPEGSAEQLAHIKDLLGTYSTSFKTSAANRRKNVTSGAAHIDGTVLYPGEQFSAYETVAPFTEANGYAMAGSYLNGETVDSMGGGICQVSSTLYNAVIRAELEIVERSPHSMIVHYVDLSADAAIAGTYKDFKFKNNTDYPIYIEGYTTDERKVVFNIYGKETRPENRKISFESVKLSETEPPTQLKDDPGQPIGYRKVSSSDKGYVAELYKVVKVDGVETERVKVNKSTYKPAKRVITYGTAGDPVASENLRAAIALQDEALANANLAAFAVPAQ